MANLLQHLSILELHGADAAKFLQGQVTCDVFALSSTQTSLAAHCNPKGRIISLFRLIQCEADRFLLVLPSDLVELTQQALSKYLVFAKATLTPLTAYYIAGYIADQTNTQADLPTTDNACSQIDDTIHICVSSAQARYLLISKQAPTMPTLTDNAWHYHEVLAGQAWLSAASSAKFLPHDLNLPSLNAVSFSKGCYTGQEIITRMQHLGTIKTHVYCYKTDSRESIVPYSLIYSADAQPIGNVVCSVQIEDGEYYCLACVKDAMANAAGNYVNTPSQLIFPLANH